MNSNKLLLNQIKKDINKAKVISFDIFDTLLVRPYVKPTDLFLHMEKAYDKPGFAAERRDAERRARVCHPQLEDITFDMIYEEIDEEFRDLKQKEMDWEEMVLRANPELKKVYDYVKAQGKKIVITSDMYLPTKFLAKVLKKNGFDGWDKLYVSGDLGKTKVRGSLFYHILDELNVNAKEVLHIGDNEKSDIECPKERGIQVWYYKKNITRLLEENERAKVFYQRHKNELGASILLGTIAWAYFEDCFNYWHDFGFKYAGPTVYAFMKWLDEQLKKDDINEVMFVARDGYTLQRVFDLIKTRNVVTHYYYCPRTLNLSDEKERSNYQSYISRFNLREKNIALVDSISARLSAQRALMVCNEDKNIKGYYWYCYALTQENIATFQTKKTREFVEWNMMEWFMTAPTPPIDRIENGEVVFKETHPNEQRRIESYPEVSQGAVDYAKVILSVFGKNEAYLSAELITEWVNCLCLIPTDLDKNWFSQIQHAWDPQHTCWKPLPATWFGKNKLSEQQTYKKKYYLFGFIPVMKRLITPTKEKLFFCGVLLWKIKIKNNKYKHFLFGFIPCLKTNEKKLK